jgi:hypothetical protein
VRAAETVSNSSRGYDAGKRINGRKRHLAVDTMRLLLVVMVSAANLQDRPAARQLLPLLHNAHPATRHLWADGDYRGTLAEWAKTTLGIQSRSSTNSPAKPASSRYHADGWSSARFLDHPSPSQRPRLRTPPRTLRSLHPLVHDHYDDPTPGPPQTQANTT